MKRHRLEILQGVLLLVLSIFFYGLHYLIFKDLHHIFIYLMGDIAFVFIEVLLVTLIIHRVMHERDKNERMVKLNMIIGAFFSEVGGEILKRLSVWDPKMGDIQNELAHINDSAIDERFSCICQLLKDHKFQIDVKNPDWIPLKEFLASKKEFLLRLLENPVLLEHESFTDLLWAVFHLAEELEARDCLEALPDADCAHLYGDSKRVYRRLVKQWVKYMEHMQVDYPYLFSLSVRMNPFDQDATAVIGAPSGAHKLENE